MKLALDAKARLGECPRWDERAGLLYWVDINSFQLHRFQPDSKINETLTFDEEVGCFALREKGGFVLGMRSGLYLIDDFSKSGMIKVGDPEEDKPWQRFNDGRAGPDGAFYAGTVNPRKDHSSGGFYRLSHNLKVEQLDSGFLTFNGLVFDEKRNRVYYSDTPLHRIYVAEWQPTTGKILNRRVFHQFDMGQGRPDGAAMDVNGCLWVAMYAGSRVDCLDPDGNIIDSLAVPAHSPTMVCFGGKNMDELFITSASDGIDRPLFEHNNGGLFTLQMDVKGITEHRFQG